MTVIELLESLTKAAKEYRKDRESIRRNEHMNKYRGELPSQELIDAIIADFINFVGVKQCVDYALYTKDLAGPPDDRCKTCGGKGFVVAGEVMCEPIHAPCPACGGNGQKRFTFTALSEKDLDELEEVIERYSVNGVAPYLMKHKADSLIGMAKSYLRLRAKL